MKDRLALITGAAGGIGSATVYRFCSEGWNVAACDINPHGLSLIVDRCEKNRGHASMFAFDVLDDDAIYNAYNQIRSSFGCPDVIIHCAGVGRYAPFMELSMEDWQNMINVNLLGVVKLTRVVLPDMMLRKQGRIIVVGSRRGIEPTAGTSAYSATKAALIGLVRGLALEVADYGIQVCLIAPGGVKTDFGNVNKKDKDQRYLEPETVADSIAHIANTPKGAWIRDLTLIPLGL